MAQKIILKHNSGAPSDSVISNISLGELLVRHADTNVDSALYTKNNKGEKVSFPSKDYVDSKIGADIVSGTTSVSELIAGISQDVQNLTSGSNSNFALIDKILPVSEFNVDNGDTVVNRIETVDNKLGDITDVKQAIADAKDDVLDLIGITSGESIATQIEAINETLDKLDTNYVSETEWTQHKSELDSAITAKTVKVVVTENDFIKINPVNGTSGTTGTTYTIETTDKIAKSSVLSALEEKYNAFVNGTASGDTALSIAQNAANSVYEKIMTGDDNTKEAFDTLQEIAEWIGSGDVEKTTAAGMLTSISNLKGVIPSEQYGAGKSYSTVNAHIEAVDAKFAGYYTTGEIDGKIRTLNTSIENAKTTLTEHENVTEGVKVVKSTNGSDNYDITAVGLATSKELSAVENKVDTVIENYVKDIKHYSLSGSNVVETTVKGNVDLTEMVIDGGTY